MDHVDVAGLRIDHETAVRGVRGDRSRGARLAALPSSPTGNPTEALPAFALGMPAVAGAHRAIRRGEDPAAPRPGVPSVGNEDAAALELDTAQRVFDQLGAPQIRSYSPGRPGAR